jgi:hypothetical protein
MPRQLADVCDRIAQVTGADYIWLIAGPRSSSKGGDLTPVPQPSPGRRAPISRSDEPRRPRLITDRPLGHTHPASAPKRARPADNRPANRARAA